MAGGIVIPLSADPRKLIRGLKLSQDEFESLQDELRDVERAGDRMEDALEDNFRDTARAAERYGRDTADEFGNETSKIGGIGAEVADEFSENFGEAIRSGNPADLVLETFTSLGPALGALGLGAAVVAGIVKEVVESGAEAKARIQEATKELFLSAAEAEEQGKITQRAFVNGIISEAQATASLIAATGAEDLQGAMIVLQEEAARTGVEVDTVALAFLGNKDAIDEINAAIAKTSEELDKEAGKTQTVTGYYGEQLEYATSTTRQLEEQQGALRDLRDRSREQRDANRDNYQILKDTEAVQRRIADEAERAARAPRGGRVGRQ